MATKSGPKPNDLFTALGHPLRRQILRTMLREKDEITPRDLATNLDEPLSALSYHVRVLAECKTVELVRTKQIRGSTQHFYRPTIKVEWARTALRTTVDPPKKDRPRGEEKS